MHVEQLYIKRRTKSSGVTCFKASGHLYSIRDDQVVAIELGTTREELVRPLMLLKLDYATKEEFEQSNKKHESSSVEPPIPDPPSPKDPDAISEEPKDPDVSIEELEEPKESKESKDKKSKKK